MTTKQKGSIFIILLLTGVALFFVWTGDNLEIARKQLRYFYSAGLDSCKIVEITERGYPQMRGQYSLFKTDCIEEYFAIRPIDSDLTKSKSLFSVDKLVYKQPGSYDIQVIGGDRTEIVSFATMESQDRRPLGYKIVLVVSAVLLLLIILFPAVVLKTK